MARKAGPPMRRLLALHIEWLRANGYPVKNTQSTSEKKKKRKKEKKKTPLAINLKIII